MAHNRRSEGVVYVASGRKYVEEAARSRRTLLSSLNTYPVCLITDEEPPDGPWDHVIVTKKCTRTFQDKIEMRQSPFERTIFLDTDTRVLASLDPVFDLLKRFDIVAHQTPFGLWYDLDGVPDAFPEFNTGVIAFRRSPVVDRFFESWHRYFSELGRYRLSEDQVSFRKALYESDLRYAWLPPEYNIMPYMPTRLGGKVVVAHGRDKVEWMIREVSESDEWRAWVPRLGLIPDYNLATWRQLGRLYRRIHFMLIAEALKRGLKFRPDSQWTSRMEKRLGILFGRR